MHKIVLCIQYCTKKTVETFFSTTSNFPKNIQILETLPVNLYTNSNDLKLLTFQSCIYSAMLTSKSPSFFWKSYQKHTNVALKLNLWSQVQKGEMTLDSDEIKCPNAY